jgi:hypothetical protein
VYRIFVERLRTYERKSSFLAKKTGHFGAGRTSELAAEQTIRRTLGLLSTNGCFNGLPASARPSNGAMNRFALTGELELIRLSGQFPKGRRDDLRRNADRRHPTWRGGMLEAPGIGG